MNTPEELTPDELAALERDSKNEYTPWLTEGITELQYYHKLYLEKSDQLGRLVELWKGRPLGLDRYCMPGSEGAKWIRDMRVILGL